MGRVPLTCLRKSRFTLVSSAPSWRAAFSEVPAVNPPAHRRDAPPGSAGVPPASSPLGCRSDSLRWCSRPPCPREPHRPGRSRALAPSPVDSGGGDGHGCARYCAGGTPALPGGSHPLTSSHQSGKECRLSTRVTCGVFVPIVAILNGSATSRGAGPATLAGSAQPVSPGADG